MKATILPTFCICVFCGSLPALAVPPGLGVNDSTSGRYEQRSMAGYRNVHPYQRQAEVPQASNETEMATQQSVEFPPLSSRQTHQRDRFAKPIEQSMPEPAAPARLHSQQRHVGLPPIKTKFERTSRTAPQVSETIVRPWEVPDTVARQTSANRYEEASPVTRPVQSQSVVVSSGQLSDTTSSIPQHITPALLPAQTSTSVRLHPSQSDSATAISRVPDAELAVPALTSSAASAFSKPAAQYENALRQHSPLPASKLVSPAAPARPLPKKQTELVGPASEYAQRDGFTFTVHGTAAYEQEQQPRTSNSSEPRAIRRYKTVPTLPASSSRTRRMETAVEPKPLTTSSHTRRTAPSRWFRPNPLRDAQAIDPDSAFAKQAQPRDAYVQQTAAEAVSFAQPGAGKADPIPSLADEPLDLPFGLEEKEPANEPTKQPAKAADPATDLSLDDLPFDDNGTTKKPTEVPRSLPDSPFPEKNPAANSGDKKPAADNDLPFAIPGETTPAEKPAEKKPSADDDLPFDIPGETAPKKKPEQPTTETPVEKMPPSESPTTEQPELSVPMQATPEETSPLDSPIPEFAPESKAELKPITEISISIQPPAGELPANHAEGITEENSIYYGFGQANRGWAVSSYQWEASAMCHQPLYFEEVNLERYGYSRGVLQPAVSYGQFLVNVISMPYKVIAEPPREASYTLGHYRPGSYAPYRVQYPPRSAAGGMFEAGVVLGLVFLIP